MAHYNSRLFKARKIRMMNPTPAEAALMAELRARGIRFQHERPLIGRYFADFYFAPEKLVVELDGKQHLERDRMAKDEDRTARLARAGIDVHRVSNDRALAEAPLVADEIAALLQQRGVRWEKGSTSSVPVR